MPKKSYAKKASPLNPEKPSKPPNNGASVEAETCTMKKKKKKKNSDKEEASPMKAESCKKPSLAPKREVSAIDEIFANRKKRKPENESEGKGVGKVKRKREKKNGEGKVVLEKKGGVLDEASRPRRRTGDGLKLYTEEELGFANPESGGSSLPHIDRTARFFCHTCPYVCSIAPQVKIKRKQPLVKKEIDSVITKDDLANAPEIEAVCDECGHKKAAFFQVQIRSADEPSTTFYTCKNCGITWKED